jgi:sugar phosphate isomerase/epimerase
MMDHAAEARFKELMLKHATPPLDPPPLDAAHAARLLERTANVPFFAHSYSFYRSMEHGFAPRDLLDFVYAHDLHGACLHLNDGGETSVGRMSGEEREVFRRRLEDLGLALHLEISSSDRKEVDRAINCALALDVRNIRLYARHQGPLSEVMERVYADLAYACERANQLDLHFDYEQHEDLKAAEIAAILQRLGDRRMNALFDYSNSLNAYEEPLAALRILAPFIRQVHVKGARKTIEDGGWGQIGVPQGCDEDELPGARMLHDLLMLGDRTPQVICFALEQEVDYYAPAFRLRSEADNPVIRYREPSETPPDKSKSTERLIADERRWAVQQLTWNRALVATFRELAFQVVPDRRDREVPPLAGLPEASYALKGKASIA